METKGQDQSKGTAGNGDKKQAGSMSKLLIVFLGVTSIAFLVSTVLLATTRRAGNTTSNLGFVAPLAKPPAGINICEDADPKLEKKACIDDAIQEQSGANVTEGYQGQFNSSVSPIVDPFFTAGLCPVNVHWHLGAEHLSVGEYDESGTGPSDIHERRRLSGKTRQGFQCKLYDESDTKFTKPYEWKFCTDMEVGQTYEVHWPHSAAGACGTPNQYQTPFADGVFCMIDKITATHSQIGVQGQVFTVVNDETYYYPDLMRGMIVDGSGDANSMGVDVAKYTGSTTGTSVDNTICSQYAPITWQVDRKCHLISASSFDKMCADMLSQRDDMSTDVYPHGSRELVNDTYAADNHQRSLLRLG